jgi:catechol 2,3-dioxygenase-like lactoylglutathione lyase family enzyme
MIELDHINILATDLDAVRDFLLAVLEDLEEGWRPPFDFAGYWLYLGQQPVIHLKQRAAGAEAGGGFVDHLAFSPFDFHAERKRLATLGYPVVEGAIPDTGIQQLFVSGPEGLKLELQCPRWAQGAHHA